MGKIINANGIIGEKTERAYDATLEKGNNSLGIALQKLRKEHGYSLTDLSDRLKEYGVAITPQGINRWENGYAVMNGYQLLAVSALLGADDNIDLLYGSPFLDGEGRRKLREYKIDLVMSGRYNPANDSPVIWCEMPVSYNAASAGIGEYLEREEYDYITVDQSQIPEGAKYAVMINGDSMEPYFHDKEMVWIAPCEELNIGDVGLFSCDNSGYIKMYQEEIPTEEEKDSYIDSNGILHKKPILVPYNKKYSNIVVSAETAFKIVGKVVGKVAGMKGQV